MTADPLGRAIVVGYDGSDATRAVVAVACRRAGLGSVSSDRPIVVPAVAAVESGGSPRAA